MYPNASAPDTVDLADVGRTLRRGWPAVIGFLAMGVLGAIAIVAFAPRKFDGRTSIVVRASSDRGASLLSRLSGMGELIGGEALGVRPAIETEVQVLKSRELAGKVVDSLRLQTVMRSPRGVPPSALVQRADLPGSFEPGTYRFTRRDDGTYVARGKSVTHEVRAGASAPFGTGTITLRPAAELPREFELLVLDREDAISRVQKRMDVSKSGTEIARITYRGDDSLTAAAVPNSLVAFYLERRKGTDRGTNARRVEFLTAQVESTGAELAAVERSLRRYQESSGVLDALVVGKVEIERAAILRQGLAEVEVDEGAINQMLAQAANGTLSNRQLAAYPAFLKGSTLSPLLAQMGELDAERQKLLERRTPADPEVVALDESIRAIEAQFLGMARSYSQSLAKQRVELTRQIDSLQQTLLALPAVAESGGRMQRDVIRLSQIHAALQAQLVEARLAAIGEGGDVRPIDVAVPPREPAFPRPFTTLGMGAAGGLFAGMIAALFLGWFGRWFRDPLEIERVTGIAAQRLTPGTPLLVAGRGVGAARTLLVVPIDERAQAGLVAQQLAHTATQRAVSATVLDLSGATSNGNGSQPKHDVAASIERLEQEHGLVVVQLPGLTSDATLAALRETRPVLLVAPPGRVNRARLESAVELLRRLDVPCAGVVISDPVPRIRSLS